MPREVVHTYTTPLGVPARKVLDRVVLLYDDAGEEYLQVDTLIEVDPDGDGGWTPVTGEAHALNPAETAAFMAAIPPGTAQTRVMRAVAARVAQGRGAGRAPERDMARREGGWA